MGIDLHSRDHDVGNWGILSLSYHTYNNITGVYGLEVMEMYGPMVQWF